MDWEHLQGRNIIRYLLKRGNHLKTERWVLLIFWGKCGAALCRIFIWFYTVDFVCRFYDLQFIFCAKLDFHH